MTIRLSFNVLAWQYCLKPNQVRSFILFIIARSYRRLDRMMGIFFLPDQRRSACKTGDCVGVCVWILRGATHTAFQVLSTTPPNTWYCEACVARADAFFSSLTLSISFSCAAKIAVIRVLANYIYMLWTRTHILYKANAHARSIEHAHKHADNPFFSCSLSLCENISTYLHRDFSRAFRFRCGFI